MNAPASVNKRALLRGQFADEPAGWSRVEGLSAGSGDVFWGGWADDRGVFVAGDDGAIFEFDGHVWSRQESPGRAPIHALWGLSREALWAVGWMGQILRFDGTVWHHDRGCEVSGDGKYTATPENKPLFAIDGRADGTAWAVGDGGTILRLEKNAWIAERSGTRVHLRCVRCLSDGTVLAGGADGTILRRDAEGYWHRQPTPIGATYVAALEIEPDKILLAGGRYIAEDNGFRGDLVLIEDGEVSTLFCDNRFRRFRDMDLTSQGVLIAGDTGQLHRLSNGALTQIDSGTDYDLHGVITLASGEALIVGDFGTVLIGNEAALSAFAPAVQTGECASRWTDVESGTDRQLWGLWRDPESDVLYACGEEGTVLVEDRGQWGALPPVGQLGIHALAAAPDGGLLVAGQLGEIHHFDGSSWRKVFDLMMDVTILSLWSDGAGQIFAAGDEGLVLQGDGGSFTRMASGTRSALYGLWGRDAQHLLAVGDFGLVLRWNGQRWDEFNAGTEHFLFDVWGRGLDDIFVVGLSGTIGHFNGRRWIITPARARSDLLALAGDQETVIAVGVGGRAMLHDGRRWANDPTPTEAGLRAVVGTDAGAYIAAGDRGTLLARPFSREQD